MPLQPSGREAGGERSAGQGPEGEPPKEAGWPGAWVFLSPAWSGLELGSQTHPLLGSLPDPGPRSAAHALVCWVTLGKTQPLSESPSSLPGINEWPDLITSGRWGCL